MLDNIPVTEAVLDVRDLEVSIAGLEIVRGISYRLYPGKTLVVIGESGSGKTVGAEAVAGIIPTPPARITGGQVIAAGTNLLRLSAKERRSFSGRMLAYVPQDALAALNPTFTVGSQIAELYRYHLGLSRQESRKRSIGVLERVGIPAAERRFDEYPHEFSGGMRQRVMIAMAIALNPKVVIADEPTTALDVTVQAQIMELLADLQHETGMSLMLITHDLGITADIADSVAVMYGGRIIETGPAQEVIDRPKHPYTYGLLKSFPDLGNKSERLLSIPGSPPDLLNMPKGCAFQPRCSFAQAICSAERPGLRQIGSHHSSACHFSQNIPAVSEPAHV